MSILDDTLDRINAAEGSAVESPDAQAPGAGGVPAPSPTPGGQIYRHRLPTGEPYYAPDPPLERTPDDGPFPVIPGQEFSVPGSTVDTGPVNVQQPPAEAALPPGGPVLRPSVNLDELDRQLAQVQEDLKQEQNLDQLTPFENFARAAHSEIANVLSIPVDPVANGFKRLGEELFGKGYDPDKFDPIESAKSIRRAMDAVGLPTQHIEDSLSGKFGKDSVDSALVLTALFSAAPSLAATMGTSRFAQFMQRVGKGLQNSPLRAVLTEAASTFGGSASRHLTGNDLAAIPGAIAGGSLGNIGYDVVRGTGRLAARGVNAMGQRMANRAMPSTVNASGRTPIVDPTVDPQVVKHFSEAQVQGAQMQVEADIANTIEAVMRPVVGVSRRAATRGQPINATGPQAQARFAEALDEAEDVARKMEDRFWRRVPHKLKIPMSGLHQEVDRMMHRWGLSDAEASIPYDAAKQIRTLGVQETPGQNVLPTLEKLRAVRGDIRRMRKTEQMAPRRHEEINRVLIGNLIDLEQAIDNHIAATITDQLDANAVVALEQARSFSAKMHDLFDRGPVGELLANRRAGNYNFSPERFIDELMKRYTGIQSALNISNSLSRMKNPSPGKFHPGGLAYPTAATPNEVGTLKQLETSMEEAIRTLFRDVADQMGPEQAAKFIAKHEGSFRPLAKVHAELVDTGRTLSALIAERKAVTESALARAAGMDSRQIVSSLFSGKDPQRQARALLLGTSRVSGLRTDPLAVEGLQQGVIQHMAQITKLDPIKMEALMKRPDIARMLPEVLSAEQMGRLSKLVDIAASMQRGDVGTLGQRLIPGARIVARVFGANIGGLWSRILGNTSGGSLQTAAIFSQTAQASVVKALSGLDPKVLLSRAVVNEADEKLLLAKEPMTPADVHAFTRTMRRAVTAEAALRTAHTGKEYDLELDRAERAMQNRSRNQRRSSALIGEAAASALPNVPSPPLQPSPWPEPIFRPPPPKM